MAPGTALGFFWALGGTLTLTRHIIHSEFILLAAAEKRELYRFSSDLGKLALKIADKYGSNGEKWYERPRYIFSEN